MSNFAEVDKEFTMKKTFAFLSILFALISCGKIDSNDPNGGDKEKQTCSVTGFAQKGQLVKGSQVTAFAYGEDLIATGESFPANISDDLGAFSITGKTDAPYFELRAQGYYFNEVSGEITSSPIYLEAFTKSSDKNANINILTTFTKPRIKKLIGEGKTFDDAKNQAQKEFIKALGLGETSTDFTLMNIAGDSDADALLLAVACFIQQDRTISQITTIIQSAAAEFGEAGVMSEKTCKDLFQPDKKINAGWVIVNLHNYYKEKGVADADIKILPFWKYTNKGNEDIFQYLDAFMRPSYPQGSEPSEGVVEEFKIFSSKDFTVVADQDWIHIEKTTLYENVYFVRITTDDNTTVERRIGFVSFIDSSKNILSLIDYIQGPNATKLYVAIGGDTKSSITESQFKDGDIVEVNGKTYEVKMEGNWATAMVEKSSQYIVSYPAGFLGESDYYSRITVNYPAEVNDSFSAKYCGVCRSWDGTVLSGQVNMYLKVATAAVRITCSGYDNLGYIILAGGANEYLAGTFTYPLNPDDIYSDPTLDPSVKGGNATEIKVNETDNDGILYFELPPVTLSSATIKIYDKSGQLIDTINATREMTFRVGTIQSINITKRQ